MSQDKEYNGILNHPPCDPAWDYAGAWQSCHKAKQQLETVIKYMAKIEDATTESDRYLKNHLEEILISVNSALSILD